MGIAERMRQIDGTASNWDSVTAPESQGKTEPNQGQGKPKRRIRLWPRAGGNETTPVSPAEEETATTSEETATETEGTEDNYDSEIALDRDRYGFDDGHQSGELDYQTSTLEYQLLHFSWKNQQRREMMTQLPDESRERVEFVDKYIDLFKECPSTGRSFTQAEAFALYCDYQEHIATLDPSKIPDTKTGVLLEMEEMLEAKVEAAKKAGNADQARICENAFMMISDLETSEALEEYYDMADSHQDRGSRIALCHYIKDVIDREGYCGTKEMRGHKPPIEGGALRLEKNFATLFELLPVELKPGETTEDGRVSTEEEPIIADLPISEVYKNINRADFTTEDWRFLEHFSQRGRELHNYVRALEQARQDRNNVEGYRKRAEEYKKSIEWLRSDTPTDELPDQVIDMLLQEKLSDKQIAARFYKAETSTRKRIELLRDDGDLSAPIQKAFEQSGMSRAEYADSLEAKATELHQKALDAFNGKISDEQRAKINRIPISREELAQRQEASYKKLQEAATRAKYQHNAVKHMFQRTEGDFAREVLLTETANAPEIPDNIVSYLYRNFGRDITALKVMSSKTTSPTFHTDRLCRLRQSVRKRAVYNDKYAKYQDAKYAHGGTLGFDYDTAVSESDPAGPYREESEFLTGEVLPILDQMIENRGGKVPYDEAEQEARAKAEDEAAAAAQTEGASEDGELSAA